MGRAADSGSGDLLGLNDRAKPPAYDDGTGGTEFGMPTCAELRSFCGRFWGSGKNPRKSLAEARFKSEKVFPDDIFSSAKLLRTSRPPPQIISVRLYE